MSTQVINNVGVRANAKGFGKYLLARLAPRKFGSAMHVKIDLIKPDGSVVSKNLFNAVTTAGRNGIADQILGGGAFPAPTLGKPTHMAVGTGTGGTTTLTTEVDRNALTTKTRANAVVTMVGDWAAGDATAALTEAGVLTASSGGDLWLYTTFAVVNKGAADALQITWTLTIS